MKDYRNDPTAALARFGKDRRERTASEASEEYGVRPSDRRGADGDGARTRRPKRVSYNPNFTEDNRPNFTREDHSAGGSHRTVSRRNDSARPARREYGGAAQHGADDRGGYRAGDRNEYGRGNRRFGGRPDFSGSEGEDRMSRENGENDNRPTRGGRSNPVSRGGGQYGASSGRSRGTERHGAAMRGEHRGGDDASHRRGYGSGAGDRRNDGRRGAPKEGNRGRAEYPRYDAARLSGEMRLNRFIAQSGICSRREADDFIRAGVVSVNGQVVTELGTKVKPTDEVRFNDSRVQGEKRVYLVLNKPKGYVTTLDDPHADRTVMELVKGACAERIYPVGRLDRNSVGLLLFTNDGDLTRQLTHPSYGKKKIYQVSLDKPFTEADMESVARGVVLEDGEVHADEIAYVKGNRKEVGIEIHSGRNRIVRRIFEHLGYEVKKLDRVYYAGLTKKNLKRGAWRFLTREEVERLKSGQYE